MILKNQYKEGFPIAWGRKGVEGTVCGSGSTKNFMREVIFKLPEYIGRMGNPTVLELGCGDLNFALLAGLLDMPYTGIDLESRDTWKKYPHVTLIEDNIVKGKKFGQFDVIICRDVFIHLPTDMVLNIVNRIKREVKPKLMAFTTYVDADNYKRMTKPDAAYKAIDMESVPFGLGAATNHIKEHSENKYLGLWYV